MYHSQLYKLRQRRAPPTTATLGRASSLPAKLSILTSARCMQFRMQCCSRCMHATLILHGHVHIVLHNDRPSSVVQEHKKPNGITSSHPELSTAADNRQLPRRKKRVNCPISISVMPLKSQLVNTSSAPQRSLAATPALGRQCLGFARFFWSLHRLLGT